MLMPVLIGMAALGTEGVYVLNQQRAVQAAADSAAISVANYYAAQTSATCTYPTCFTLGDLKGQAGAVTATYGFVDGTNGASVTVNKPPLSGHFTGADCSGTLNCAFEVIVTQLHSPMLSSYWLPKGITVTGRAVAVINVATGSDANCVRARHVVPNEHDRDSFRCDHRQRQCRTESAGMQRHHELEQHEFHYSEWLRRHQPGGDPTQPQPRWACKRPRRSRLQRRAKLHQRHGFSTHYVQWRADSYSRHSGQCDA
jgi:hypothetical protein